MNNVLLDSLKPYINKTACKSSYWLYIFDARYQKNH